ncbi:hypothetical protein L1049_000349 [Liquidambar formosana]|uniref:Apple domain-containing protein n=1 Tax=Liquidambar formosana TaxID=63359 RepID=A0AAP0NCL3_LIQFO
MLLRSLKLGSTEHYLPALNGTYHRGKALKILLENEMFYAYELVNSLVVTRSVANPVAKLLESGNLVMKDANDDDPENFLWQTFDYPCDTQLPGMKLGRNTITGLDRSLTSWKSNDDPSRGDFTYGLDPRGYPQIVMRKGSVEQFRAGSWNGLRFTGSPNLKRNSIYSFRFVFNQKEMYYIFELLNSSVLTRMVLNTNGLMQRFIWIERTQGWNLYLTSQTDSCDNYALCGAYGSCNIDNSPKCGCLKGFVPKFPTDWDISDWSNGCVRRTPLDCRTGDGFIKYSGVKLPDTRYSWFNESMNLKECKMVCLRNCSCMAYASLDISKGGSGCLLWFVDLIDIRDLTENGQEIYIRMASSEVGQLDSNGKKRVWIIVGSVFAVMLLLGLGLTLYIRKKKQKRKLSGQGKKGQNPEKDYTTEDLELPLFDLATIANATNNFSINNKIGEGGFGPVYKGVLEDGQEIAVKRLSKNSKQGLEEFKNEAWKLHMEDRSLELIDASIGDSCDKIEVLRSIHVGLLCVQRCPEDRPSMSSIVLMLSSESALPQPKQPGFFTERNPVEGYSSSGKPESCSANEITVTWLSAR